jgi:hypothetical protein
MLLHRQLDDRQLEVRTLHEVVIVLTSSRFNLKYRLLT